MSKRKRRPTREIAERRVRVSELLVAGVPQYKIADELGVDPATVTRDKQAIEAEWKAARVENFDTLRRREVRRLDLVERRLWDLVDEPASEKGSVADQNRKVYAEIARVVMQRAKLLGIESPQIARSLSIEFDKLTDEQKRRIARGEDPVAVVAEGA